MAEKIESIAPIRLKEYLAAPKSNQRAFEYILLTFKGREAIYLAAQHFKLEKEHIVLLPGYVCDSVPAGFSGKVEFIYYDINPDFSINTATIEKLLSTYNVRVLFVIHYFGFIHRNLPQLKLLCKRHKVLLWEDHAHSAFARFSYKYADAMFFSFRKLLPLPEGGGIWIPDFTSDLLIEHSALFSNIANFMLLAKRAIIGWSREIRDKARVMAVRKRSTLREGSKNISVKPISFFSNRIVRNADVESIFHERRKYFHQWKSFLDQTPFSPVFSELPDKACPLGFPIWISNSKEFVKECEAYKIFLKIHFRLSDDIEKISPTSWKMSKSIVTLPIYPGLKTSDMQKIMSLLVTHGKPSNFTTEYPY